MLLLYLQAWFPHQSLYKPLHKYGMVPIQYVTWIDVIMQIL